MDTIRLLCPTCRGHTKVYVSYNLTGNKDGFVPCQTCQNSGWVDLPLNRLCCGIFHDLMIKKER
jgi:hypothetical protein